MWMFPGCNVLIASRKLDRIEKAAIEMRQAIPTQAGARLEYTKCNIREEEEVGLIPQHFDHD